MAPMFLAGFSWPLEMVPGWLRTAALLLPSSAAIEGFLRINQMGASLWDVVFEWRVLWCLAGGYFLLAWWAHSRRAAAHIHSMSPASLHGRSGEQGNP
jgi:ABC-2 type transport system permease protein